MNSAGLSYKTTGGYVRVGPYVQVVFRVEFTAPGGATSTGNVDMSGLPFNVAGAQMPGFVMGNTFTLEANDSWLYALPSGRNLSVISVRTIAGRGQNYAAKTMNGLLPVVGTAHYFSGSASYYTNDPFPAP